jgi:nicotinamide mononucleotide transporter
VTGRATVSLPAQFAADMAATSRLEWLAVVAGVFYVVLIARQRRLGWICGGVSSALYVYIAWQAQLPLQAGLQLFYVLMAVYGWVTWTRAAGGEAPAIMSWPLRRHLLAIGVVVAVSLLAANWLATSAGSAWPRLDSLTTVTSVLATWMVIRSVLENWLYWIATDAVSAFMFHTQGHPLTAILFATYLTVAVVGFLTWRRSYRTRRR